MKFLTAIVLMMSCGRAFGIECENVPTAVEIELTAGTNRADGTFFGFDFDKPVTECSRHDNGFWCEIGTHKLYVRTGYKGRSYPPIKANLSKPFHGFTNLLVLCRYHWEKGQKLSSIYFRRIVPGVMSFAEMKEWTHDVSEDLEKNCSVKWDEYKAGEKKDWLRRSGETDKFFVRTNLISGHDTKKDENGEVVMSEAFCTHCQLVVERK